MDTQDVCTGPGGRVRTVSNRPSRRATYACTQGTQARVHRDTRAHKQLTAACATSKLPDLRAGRITDPILPTTPTSAPPTLRLHFLRPGYHCPHSPNTL